MLPDLGAVPAQPPRLLKNPLDDHPFADSKPPFTMVFNTESGTRVRVRVLVAVFVLVSVTLCVGVSVRDSVAVVVLVAVCVRVGVSVAVSVTVTMEVGSAVDVGMGVAGGPSVRSGVSDAGGTKPAVRVFVDDEVGKFVIVCVTVCVRVPVAVR